MNEVSFSASVAAGATSKQAVTDPVAKAKRLAMKKAYTKYRVEAEAKGETVITWMDYQTQ